MTYAPRPWTPADDRALASSIRKREPMDQIVKRLRRAEKSVLVRSIALKLNARHLEKEQRLSGV